MRWTITDHVCRDCDGRILHAVGGAVCRCADCGATTTNLLDACYCGVPSVGASRLRCLPNIQSRPPGAPEVVVEIHTTR